jgi:recombination protein RecA
MEIEAIPSGSLSLDCALGIGGYPKGRIVEIYGPESSGKTTLAIHAVAEAQKLGLLAAYIDAEHAFDREYAANLGVNVNKLLFAQPDCGEDCLEIATKLISSGKVGILVIDSVAALIPRAELEGEMGEARVGLQARLMSQALRKMVGVISKANCLCIFINQVREKIGVLFGNPETTTGGNALKFYASMRLEVRKSSAIKEGDEAVANLTKVKVVKNKCAPPFRKAEFEIEFGKGINRFNEILDKAIEFDIIHKSGSWFSYGEDKLGQGKATVVAILEDNPDLLEEIEAKVVSQINNKESGMYELEDIL